MINIADLKDPSDPEGRTWREINAAKKHKYAIGDLVELDSGARLFIADLTRDCDQTPLYTLTHDKDDGYYQVGSWPDSDLKLIARGES